MVAGIEVAVVFENESGAAAFGKDAEGAGVAGETAESDIEVLNEGCADVVADPFIEDGDEEIAEAAGVYAPCGNAGAGGGAAGGGGLGQIKAEAACFVVWQALDERNELHEFYAKVFEEVVDIEWMTFISGADDGEGVNINVMVNQELDAADDGIEGGGAIGIAAEAVVEFGRAINTCADEKIMLFEEGAPLGSEEGAIGLEGVGDARAAGVFVLELHDALKEGEAHEERFAALPCEDHFRRVERGQVVADETLEDRIGHAERIG